MRAAVSEMCCVKMLSRHLDLSIPCVQVDKACGGFCQIFKCRNSVLLVLR